MQNKFLLFILASLTLTSCSQDFKKGEENLEYKIISSGKGKKIVPGEFIELEVGQYRVRGNSDSLLQDSRNSMPYIEPLDSTNTPPSYYKILSQLHNNDSLIIRILVDSAFSKDPASMPPFFKKGDYLVTRLKVTNVYKTKEDADKARVAASERANAAVKGRQAIQLQKDDKIIQEYLKKNNIQATKAPQGTYVQIITPGAGANVDTSVVVKTNYTGKTLEGKTFDSNVDSAYNHVEPFMVNMTNDPSLGQPVIAGWKDGMVLLNKGAKAKFYIPSPLAYGEQGAGNDIKPNTVLVFDIEVVDVLNRAQARVIADQQRKKMEDQMKMQQMIQEQMQNMQNQNNPK